jgi:hypothetical protein
MMNATATSPAGTRDARRVELRRMTKYALLRVCATRGMTGGYSPVERWTKAEIISAILTAEFPENAE